MYIYFIDKVSLSGIELELANQYQSAESECNDFNIFMIIMLGIDKLVPQLVGKGHAHHIDGKKLMDTTRL